MAKPTQAHLTRTISRSRPEAFREQTKRQMEYYMGAKLLEVGVNPKSAIYRWNNEVSGNSEMLTYSAYWGESKEAFLKDEG